ncbi:hypothetical protein [Ralstonia sp.]|uniref:hypothetical protein n=1 Tax=Ralstonia sp. TaxID=54061 RepID=UPI0031D34A6E
MAGSQNVARIIGVIGASGSGKSRWGKGTLRFGIKAGKIPRLLAWDPQDEYGEEFGRIFTDIRELIAALAALEEGDSFRFIYRPGDDMATYKWKFDLFCEIAYQIENLCVVVEELADVTTPSWAPPFWSRLSRKGRHRAMTIFAYSQRPTLMDKTFLGNCTMIHCARLNDENDIRTMSRYLGVTEQQVRDLLADDQTDTFQFIERDMKTGETRFGDLASSRTTVVKQQQVRQRNERSLPEPAADVT